MFVSKLLLFSPSRAYDCLLFPFCFSSLGTMYASFLVASYVLYPECLLLLPLEMYLFLMAPWTPFLWELNSIFVSMLAGGGLWPDLPAAGTSRQFLRRVRAIRSELASIDLKVWWLASCASWGISFVATRRLYTWRLAISKGPSSFEIWTGRELLVSRV